ncbi:hypothetical protein O7605_14630 [Verrucosispora sp. WMMA2121]|uniref:hypothetical protein n=1 Tax=Verrucosispora sp. WMMA2121 TaxID=3015164 RepID=UPI0022B73551|nr:hypothetical protein [Verrucosispora sp. WMMA2121]MCZ7420752.1 hypothetical protein [Verrucosispora sp. WMMA2121]
MAVLMDDDLTHERGPARRQLRDLGRPLVVLVAPLLVHLANRDKRFVWTVAEVRGHARDWPPSGGDAEMANLFRFQAWFGLSMVPLAVYIVASLLRSDPTASNPGHEAVMTVAVTVSMFALGMFLVSALKCSLSQYFRPDLDRRLGPPRRRDPRPVRRRPGFLVRLCLPSNLDWVLALIFASCFAPALYPGAGT